jgi:uncharacterized protein (TIGR03118 family)
MQILSSKFSALACAMALLPGLSFFSTPAQAQSYSVVKLTSDLPGVAPNQDTQLVNPWGLAALAGEPWWVSDNNSGLSTLYNSSGVKQSLVVTIPPGSIDPTAIGSPTGIVANSTSSFGGAAFIFDTEDGTIQAWTGASSAEIKVDKGTAAVYKGLTATWSGDVAVLYAANFGAGTIEEYDTNFNPIALAPGAFTDPRVPAGWAPFNVQAIGGAIYVTYAKQAAGKQNQEDGAGLGIVDKFNTSGTLLVKFQHGTFLNAPWGVAVAPASFGSFSNDVLVGNFGSGQIVAFNPSTGAEVGVLDSSSGSAITIPGLWALAFGDGGSSGPTTWLFFTAGIEAQAHGLFGYIVAAE